MENKEKWNRLLDAFAGRGTPAEPVKYPEISVEEMARVLAGLTEEEWGRYAFSREPLEGKFDEEQKKEYTRKANACGREWAERIAGQYGTRSPRLLSEKMGMEVKTMKVPLGGELVLFAQFVQPNEITVFTDCIDKAPAFFERERLMDILLAHELFHAVEEEYSKEIYTRTEKVELWRKPFSNRSGIACLSEIAAMAFAGQLVGLDVSPYMLDVLLVYAYDKNVACGLFDEICCMNKR